MNSGEFRKALLGAIVPGGIMACFTTFLNLFNRYSIFIQLEIIIATYIVATLLIFFGGIIWDGWLKARFDLWRIGKIRGLWKEKGLIKQVQRCFSVSTVVKIKVTRGYDLLSSNNEFGISAILDELKNGKGKKHNEKVEIQFLLMLPCFQEGHVRERYERHTNLSEEDYLETWYKFIEKIRGYVTDNLSINVRFYYGNHAKWRFYVFSKPTGANTDVLLSSYEKEDPGSSEPMYKIIKGEQNIGSFMTDYFDEMWKTALTPQKLYQYINRGKCHNGFCVHCIREKKDSCVACDRPNCIYESSCKHLIKKYKVFLERFNAR